MGMMDFDFLDDVRRMNKRQVNNFALMVSVYWCCGFTTFLCQETQENGHMLGFVFIFRVPTSCRTATLDFFFDLAESKIAVFLCSILTSDGIPFCFGKNSFL